MATALSQTSPTQLSGRARTLLNLARPWQASGDARLPALVAPVVGWSVEEVEQLFRAVVEE